MDLRMIISPDLCEWIDCTVCYVYPEPVDSRLGFNGLSKLLKELDQEPSIGDAFAFFVKEPKRKRYGMTTGEDSGCIKLLQWDEVGKSIIEIHGPDAERLKEMTNGRARPATELT